MTYNSINLQLKPPTGVSTSLQKVVLFNVNPKGKMGLTFPLKTALVYGLRIDFNYKWINAKNIYIFGNIFSTINEIKCTTEF